MASSHIITSWQIEGERWKQWQISSSWALKPLQMVTAAMKSGDDCFLAGKPWQTQTVCWKAKDVTLPTKAHTVKAMVCPAVTYGCESWTIKKADCRRIDTFKLWCWRRLLRVPWTATRLNQSIFREVNPEYSHWKDWYWSWRSSILVTWCEQPTHWKRPWCWEGLRAEGEEGVRRWDD